MKNIFRKLFFGILLLFLSFGLFACDFELPNINNNPPTEDVTPGENDNQEQEENKPDEQPDEEDELPEDFPISIDGLYTSRDEVALYIVTFKKLPSNYITKSEAGGSNGNNIKNLYTPENKLSIGGDRFGNRERLLPIIQGITYTELDIDYKGITRGAKRIVYSSDFIVYYTADHYGSFVRYYPDTKTWGPYTLPN